MRYDWFSLKHCVYKQQALTVPFSFNIRCSRCQGLYCFWILETKILITNELVLLRCKFLILMIFIWYGIRILYCVHLHIHYCISLNRLFLNLKFLIYLWKTCEKGNESWWLEPDKTSLFTTITKYFYLVDFEKKIESL